MSKSKSKLDIRIPLRHSCGAPDVNCNFIVTNLLKSKLYEKLPEYTQTDAYDLAAQQRMKEKIENADVKICQFPIPKRNKLRRTVSQDEIHQLVSLEDQLKSKAFQSLCRQSSTDKSIPLKANIKDLVNLNTNHMKGRTKRVQMTKKIMTNAMQKHKKVIKNEKKESFKQSIQYSENSQSIRSIESTKIFNNSAISNKQQKRQKKEREKYVQNILRKKDFNEAYNTQRRKQTWKGFQQAQRTKVIMKNPDYLHNMKITFIEQTNKNKNEKKMKKKKDNRNQNNNRADYFKTLTAFKQFQINFQKYSSQYKLKAK